MKTTPVFCLLLLLVLSGFKCRKESEDCHRIAVFRNQSSQPVYFTQKFVHASDPSECQLSGRLVPVGASFEIEEGDCWEMRLGDGDTFDYYVVDPTGYQGGGFHPCDSLELHYNILSQQSISLDAMEAGGFAFHYT